VWFGAGLNARTSLHAGVLDVTLHFSSLRCHSDSPADGNDSRTPQTDCLFEMTETYGQCAVSFSIVDRCDLALATGKMTFDDDERPGRPLNPSIRDVCRQYSIWNDLLRLIISRRDWTRQKMFSCAV
jgi:hypothetical protein